MTDSSTAAGDATAATAGVGASPVRAATVKPRTPRSRPDPRPARLMIGAGAVAAAAFVAAGLVHFPVTDEVVTAASTAPGTEKARATNEKRPVRYVRLKPGQKAPPGAKVIREAAPKPRVVVRLVAPAASTATRTTVTRTRQSGR
jgi:hypothetical protein